MTSLNFSVSSCQLEIQKPPSFSGCWRNWLRWIIGTKSSALCLTQRQAVRMACVVLLGWESSEHCFLSYCCELTAHSFEWSPRSILHILLLSFFWYDKIKIVAVVTFLFAKAKWLAEAPCGRKGLFWLTAWREVQHGRYRSWAADDIVWSQEAGGGVLVLMGMTSHS